MNRIVIIAFAAAMSTLALSAAQAGAPNGLSTTNAFEYGNGLGSENGLSTTNAFEYGNGLGTYNGWGNGTMNGISISEKAGQTILEIRLTDGTVACR